jgi:G protein-coupled receptor 135
MVLYVVFAHLRFRTVTNTFITTLSVADLLSTAVCMPMALVTLVERRWLFGDIGCAVNGTASAALSVLSTVMVTFITIDRYFVVVRLPRGRPLAVPSAVLAIALATALSIAVSAPWHLLSGHLPPPLYREGYVHCNYLLHLAASPYPGGPAFGIAFLLVCFVLPSGYMVFCSASLWKLIHNNDSQIRPVTAPASAIRFNGEMRTAKTVVIMVLLYLVSRAPLLLTSVVYAALGQAIPPSVDTSVVALLWLSCAANPLIYACRNPTVANFLRRGKRQSGYEAEKRLHSAPVPHVAHVEALSQRQFKYLPNAASFDG